MVLTRIVLRFKQRNQPSTVRQLQWNNIQRKNNIKRVTSHQSYPKCVSRNKLVTCTCTHQQLHHVTFKHRYMESHTPQPTFNSPARIIPDILHPVEYVKGGGWTRSEYIYRRIHMAALVYHVYGAKPDWFYDRFIFNVEKRKFTNLQTTEQSQAVQTLQQDSRCAFIMTLFINMFEIHESTQTTYNFSEDAFMRKQTDQSLHELCRQGKCIVNIYSDHFMRNVKQLRLVSNDYA